MATTITRDGVRGEHVEAAFADPGPGRPAVLTFDNGLSRARLAGDPALQGLLAAWFGDPLPLAWVAGTTVHVKYPIGARLLRKTNPNTIHISPRVPWTVDLHGGVERLEADLSGIDLHAFTSHGGAADVRLVLGRPSGTCTIRLDSVRALRLVRPGDVPVRIELGKGATDVALDDRRFGAVGGGLTDETSGYDTAQARYLVVVPGGAAGLAVGRA